MQKRRPLNNGRQSRDSPQSSTTDGTINVRWDDTKCKRWLSIKQRRITEGKVDRTGAGSEGSRPNAQQLSAGCGSRDGQSDLIFLHGDLPIEGTFMVHLSVPLKPSLHIVWNVHTHLADEFQSSREQKGQVSLKGESCNDE